MQSWRVLFTGLLIAGLFSLLPVTPVSAQQAETVALPSVTTLIKDRDFRELNTPVRTSVPDGDIEVIAFFHYGSPWVGQVAPYVQAWEDQNSSRVHFHWAPAILDNDWGWGARVYFALDQLGEPDSLNTKLMVAFGNKELKDGDNKSLVDWLSKNGVDPKVFLAAANDGKVLARTAWVPSIMNTYEVRTVPTFVINGRYVIETSDAVSPVLAFARMRYIVNSLLAKK